MQRVRRTARGSLAIAALILFLNTTIRAEGFPEFRPAALPFTQSLDGLTVSALPLADEDDLDEYFGDDLLDDGILPVFVRFENRSADRSFIILKDQVGVALTQRAQEGDVASPTAGGWVSTAGVGAVLVVPVASLVLLPIGINMVSDAYEAKRNFVVKELQTQTLSPGTQTSGFVYLKAPEGADEPPRKLWLRAEALQPRGGQPTRLELPLSWSR